MRSAKQEATANSGLMARENRTSQRQAPALRSVERNAAAGGVFQISTIMMIELIAFSALLRLRSDARSHAPLAHLHHGLQFLHRRRACADDLRQGGPGRSGKDWQGGRSETASETGAFQGRLAEAV